MRTRKNVGHLEVEEKTFVGKGSIILAGVLLKLGGYGLLRVFPILINFYRLGFI
jgi:hypothetical protein